MHTYLQQRISVRWQGNKSCNSMVLTVLPAFPPDCTRITWHCSIASQCLRSWHQKSPWPQTEVVCICLYSKERFLNGVESVWASCRAQYIIESTLSTGGIQQVWMAQRMVAIRKWEESENSHGLFPWNTVCWLAALNIRYPHLYTFIIIHTIMRSGNNVILCR